jgi:hypothetical protein
LVPVAQPSVPNPPAVPFYHMTASTHISEFVELPVAPRNSGRFWLDGDAVFCACPDCSAPMSVRLWLLIADCWRCGTTIELTEEQEREVERLLAVEPGRGSFEPVGRGSRRAEMDSLDAPPPPFPATQDAPPADPIAPPIPSYHEPWLRHLLNETPAWLISMLVHMLLFMLLALLTMEEKPRQGPLITLSAALSRKISEGGDRTRIREVDLASFDMPIPSKADLENERHRKLLQAAAQDALELRLDDNTPNLPDLDAVKSRVGRADGYELAFAARDPRLRAEVVTQEGGTTLTEAAVARGLRWLANHQNHDGSWNLRGFKHAADCNCSGDGTVRTTAPGTALALLPFLGAGQTHLAGRYSGTVSRGLRWLIQHQHNDGDLRFDATGNEGMYAHGQAAIVLCEAFAMTGDEALRVPAQRAINFIVEAQYNDGGWRYRPGPKSQRGDTSVVGWQLMALQSARSAGLTIPDETWDMSDAYLDGVQFASGARYSYQTRSRATATMTAEALLCRLYLGWKSERPALSEGIRWLMEDHFPTASSPNIYYWYYATQVMHHHGGQVWDDWNQQMRDILVASQETQGHVAGSWRPRGEFSGEGGRIYMTSLAICTLEVYYRHLPVFRRIDLQ